MLLSVVLLQLTGLAILAIQAYQDLKTMTVDTRLNFFMYGIVMGFGLQISPIAIALILATILIIYVYFNLIRRFYDLGEADPEAMAWVYIPFLLNPTSGLFQIMVFTVALPALLTAAYIKNKGKKLPFVPMIAVAYALAFSLAII